jgi:hypothetical protein
LHVSPAQFRKVPKSVQELDSFLEQVSQYSDDVCIILKHDVVLAKLDMLLQDLLR